MKLFRDEDVFLRRWIYDEARYDEAPGPAKRLQVQHRAVPAELADIIAAAFPDPLVQEAIAFGPPPEAPLNWPWSSDELHRRVVEARSALACAQDSGHRR